MTAGAAGPAELADQIAAAVRGCPGVARLASGPLATYLPGRRVQGVAVRGDRVRIAIVARYGAPLADIGAGVLAAVSPLAGDRTVDVQIDDIETGAAGAAGPGPDGPEPGGQLLR